VASQLDQLLGYLERQGVSEVALSPGKPITMTTPKGVVNVTGRSLTFDQLASIVRGTPIEALVADETSGPDPVVVTLGKRDVMIAIERAGDTLTVRLRSADVPQPRPRGARARTKPPVSRTRTVPPSDTLKAPAMPAPKAPAEPTEPTEPTEPEESVEISLEPDVPLADIRASTRDLLAPAGAQMPPSALDELPRKRSSSIAPPLPAGPHPNDMRARSPSLSPFAGVPVTPSPPPTSPLDVGELPGRPPPQAPLDPSTSSAAPPPIEVPLPPPRRNKLRIDVSSIDDGASVTHDGSSGAIALPRGRALDALGLPGDLGTHLRERTLVIVASLRGHGKTSTLDALVDVIDRAGAPHVITIDELRDRESVDFAITAAESGYLVLATITAPNAAASIERIIDHYPGMAHGRVKTRLLGAVGLVIGKRLPPTPSEIIAGAALRALLGN
jgi:hypothetical protein